MASMRDNPKEIQQRLTQYMNEVVEALDLLENLDPQDFATLPQEEESHHRRYQRALDTLKWARIWLTMVAEQLEDLLQDYQAALIEAPFTSRRNGSNTNASEKGEHNQQTA